MSKQRKLRHAVARMCFCALAATPLMARAQTADVLLRSTYRGDYSYDGVVNALDFNALAANFGSSVTAINGGSLNVNGGATLLDDSVEVRPGGKSSQAQMVEIEHNYLQRVLERQIDAAGFDINPEALKALAVADRSLVHHALEHRDWVGSGGSAPTYKPSITITPSATAAEQATEHEVLLNTNGSFANGLTKLGKRPADLASAKATDFTLSLNGADFLADHGFNYLDILHFYYGANRQLKLGTVLNPFVESIQPRYIYAGTKILADFEHDEGILQSAGAPNSAMRYVNDASANDSLRSFKSPLKGKASEQVNIDYNERADGKRFVYQMLTGVSGGEGTKQGNLLLPATGEIGFYLRTKTPNLQAQIAVNDSDRVENSIAERIIADDKWHKYVWAVGDKHNWKGKGGSVQGPFTLNSLYLTGNSDATVHIDSVFYNEQAHQKPTITSPGSVIAIDENGAVQAGGTLNFGGIGTIDIVKTGAGSILLNGSNNYIGDITVNSGSLAISSGSVGTFSPVIVSGSGTLDFTAANVIGNSLIGNSLSYSTAPWILNSGTLLLSDLSMAGQYAVLAQPSGIPGTVLVPEPAAIGLLVAMPALLHRRRKSDI